MHLQEDLAELRETMSGFPAVDAHTASKRIDPAEIYFPKAHARALDPDRSLVIGNRGMGKSYWASALVNPETREKIAAALPASRLAGHQVDIVFGFAEGEGNVGISRDQLANLLDTGAPVETIWRAVTLPAIAALSGQPVPADLAVRLQWARDQPTIIRDILRNGDAELAQRRGRLMFVFDQLEQLSDDFERRRHLIQGILRLALAYKSLTRIAVATP